MIKKLWDNTSYFKKELEKIGLPLIKSETPITPILIGDEAEACRFSNTLFKLGLFAQAIVFPTVPKGKARIRTIMTAQHSKEELDKALEIIETGAKKAGLL